MDSLGSLIDRAHSWSRATGLGTGDDQWQHPYLGTPWQHSCDRLRSSRLTVSVVIPVWNSADSIGACLEALAMSSLNRLAPGRLEVIVCDDGSTDDTWDVIAGSTAALDLSGFRLEHRSQSAALNAAIDRAAGDLVVCCDSDILMGCGALDELATRHEQWDDAVCFGFRSNIEATRVATEPLWSLIHTEAFSADNRVAFDLPTLVPNMLVANDWLRRLDGGRYMLDSRSSDWRRHRFVYGCLFSARRDHLIAVGGFPDAMVGWGYNDTLVAGRLEAAGAFLLPVTSAWGHHVVHDLRHPDQWFQMSRNDLAYRYLLDESPRTAAWRATGVAGPIDTVRFTNRIPAVRPATKIHYDVRALAGLGRWAECLAGGELDDDLAIRCLYELGHYQDAAGPDGARRTAWSALAQQRLGRTDHAIKTLIGAADHDPSSAYLLGASAPELSRLANHYQGHQMPRSAENYRLAADLLTARDGSAPAPLRALGAES